MNRIVHACCLLVLLLLAGSCASTKHPEQWQPADVRSSSERILSEVTRLTLDKNNFPGGTGLDPTTLSMVSGWNISLAPFRGKGFRERCHIRYQRQKDGNYKVEVRVERQRNDDILRPLDLTYAQWEEDPDNVERARVVLQYLRSLLAQQ